MADTVLMEEICDRLCDAEFENRIISAESEGRLSTVLGLNKAWSNTKVKRALGRLVRDGKVIRHRCRPQYIGHDD